MNCIVSPGVPKMPMAKNGKSCKAEFDARLDKMKREALQTGWLKPQAVYGFFPCQADGDDLIIYDPESVRRTAVRPCK